MALDLRQNVVSAQYLENKLTEFNQILYNVFLLTRSSLFQGSDKSYLIKQHQELEEHPNYIKGNDRRTWEKEFGILHYAGAVTYTAAGFLDKNKDVQQDQLFELMYNSLNAFVQDLTRFQVRPEFFY